jgi:hypothetical protein
MLPTRIWNGDSSRSKRPDIQQVAVVLKFAIKVGTLTLVENFSLLSQVAEVAIPFRRLSVRQNVREMHGGFIEPEPELSTGCVDRGAGPGRVEKFGHLKFFIGAKIACRYNANPPPQCLIQLYHSFLTCILTSVLTYPLVGSSLNDEFSSKLSIFSNNSLFWPYAWMKLLI